MKFSVDLDISSAVKLTNSIAKQIPFAMAKALTQTAIQAQTDIVQAIRCDLPHIQCEQSPVNMANDWLGFFAGTHMVPAPHSSGGNRSSRLDWDRRATSCSSVTICETPGQDPLSPFMSSLQDRFAQAQQDVNSLSERPDNDTMLRLYGLFKQATKGDATAKQPGGFDFVARAKFDAWSKMKGTSIQDAMQQYVDLVVSLRG